MNDNSQSFLRRLPRALGRYLMIVMRGFVKISPRFLYKGVRECLVLLGRLILFKKYQVILSNLKNAYGEAMPPKERKTTARKCFDNVMRQAMDIVYYSDRLDALKENVVFDGRHYLDTTLKEGKGAVLVSAHFGNFILMYFIMALYGYDTHVIMKRVRDKKMEEYISSYRNAMGVKTIYDLPARQCVVNCIKALRGNGILFILLDQNYGSEGRVFVDFFGKPAATATGPVVFAQRTRSPILPIFIQSNGDLKYRISIHPQVPLNEEGSDEDILTKNIAVLTQIIETHIRYNPSEWGGWMHKRWKTKPSA